MLMEVIQQRRKIDATRESRWPATSPAQRWLFPLGRGLEILDPGLLSHPAEFSVDSSHCPVLEQRWFSASISVY